MRAARGEDVAKLWRPDKPDSFRRLPAMPRFSQRVSADLTPSPWAARVAAVAEIGAIRHDLTLSNPTRAQLAYPPELLRPLADPRGLTYAAQALGSPEARAAVAALYVERGFDVTPDDVVLTASSSEAYAYLFKLFCDPQDSVLIPTPSYPLFSHLAALEGVALEAYELRYDGAWHLQPEPICPGPRCRLILAVSPNNPTGSSLSLSELARLAELGLPLVSDEVFASYPLAEGGASSALELSRAGDAAAPCVVLGGLSKELGLPQLKLGWLLLCGAASWRAAVRQRLELMCDSFLSVNGPVQLALPELIREAAVVRAAIQRRVKHNHTYLAQRLAGTPATLLQSCGGWYACVQLPSTQSDEQWALELLGRGVLVQPGYFYDLPIEPCVVISLLTPTASLNLGVEALLDCLARL